MFYYYYSGCGWSASPNNISIILFFNTQNYQFRQWSKQSNILQHSNSTGIDTVSDERVTDSQSRWPKSYFKGMLSSFHFHSTTSIPDLANHLHDTAKRVTSTFILSNTLQHHIAYSCIQAVELT